MRRTVDQPAWTKQADLSLSRTVQPRLFTECFSESFFASRNSCLFVLTEKLLCLKQIVSNRSAESISCYSLQWFGFWVWFNMASLTDFTAAFLKSSHKDFLDFLMVELALVPCSLFVWSSFNDIAIVMFDSRAWYICIHFHNVVASRKSSKSKYSVTHLNIKNILRRFSSWDFYTCILKIF